MNSFITKIISMLFSFLFFWNRLELNFAVNVAATYTLTELVMPSLEKAAPDARVITVASGGMYTEPLNKDLQVIIFLGCLRLHYISL